MNADLDLALRLADAADAITLPRFRAADLRVERKPDRTPVTDADLAAEDALRALIGAERPDDVVVGEERGGALADAERAWVLDPIDGTKNFSRGFGVWGSLIALTVRGEPVVGVASAPALGRRWWAARGDGRLDQRRARGAAAPDRGVRDRRAGRRLPVDHRLPALRALRARRAATSSWPPPAGRPAPSATSGSTAWSPRG